MTGKNFSTELSVRCRGNMAPKSTSTVAETGEPEVLEMTTYKTKIVWLNVLSLAFLHVTAVYGLYLAFTKASTATNIFTILYLGIGGIGVTAGAHRLWSHRAYKAKFPLRLFYCMCFSIAGQNDIFEWCRDHRVHHKFTETTADPHNIKRGFFFAHVGWLMCMKHPDVTLKGKTVNLDDLLEDPIVVFHRKFYMPIAGVFCFLIPTLIPYWYWGENLLVSFMVCGIMRYCLSLHTAWLVNSAAHYSGSRPYDKKIEARQNASVAFLALGEGWHNYHHAFPWDYGANEYGYTLNPAKIFIDLMEWVGLAYDLKRASSDTLEYRKEKAKDA